MFIFMLMMMMVPALTRKRAHEKSPNLHGSSTANKPARKRNTRSSKASGSVDAHIFDNVADNVASVGQPSTAPATSVPPNGEEIASVRQPSSTTPTPIPQNEDEIADQRTEEPVIPPKRRGKNINAKLETTFKALPEGTKISLVIDKNTKSFVGSSATVFATECGITIRNLCSMEHHKWDKIPQTVKNVMYEKFQLRFDLQRSNLIFMDCVNARLREHWKRYRGELSKHWKSVGGKTNPQLARQSMKPGCRDQADLNYLCDYWEKEQTQNYSKKMEDNRAKQFNVSRGGSRSIANLVHSMRNTETETPPIIKPPMDG